MKPIQNLAVSILSRRKITMKSSSVRPLAGLMMIENAHTQCERGPGQVKGHRAATKNSQQSKIALGPSFFFLSPFILFLLVHPDGLLSLLGHV